MENMEDNDDEWNASPKSQCIKAYKEMKKVGGLRSIKETTGTEKYRLSDYGKETNKGHNSLLKSVKKKDTKKEYKDNIKKHKTKHRTRETTT